MVLTILNNLLTQFILMILIDEIIEIRVTPINTNSI